VVEHRAFEPFIVLYRKTDLHGLLLLGGCGKY